MLLSFEFESEFNVIPQPELGKCTVTTVDKVPEKIVKFANTKKDN